MFNAAEYQQEIKNDIITCLEDMSAQPILFIGSGLSRRYFSAPNWLEILNKLADRCPNIQHEFGYYRQKYDNPAIGTIFAEKYQDWAWGAGRDIFPSDLFSDNLPSDIYVKHMIGTILKQMTPISMEEIDAVYHNEIELLKSIRPHAIITTNYDMLLEMFFPDYAPIIGQKILRGESVSIGEIFKIHGCISDISTLVFHEADYDNFFKKKKYLSAKLLAYFAEHPLLFIGYSANDENIKTILADIDEILAPKGELIPNIYMLEWTPEPHIALKPATEKIIPVTTDHSVRVKSILSHDFGWVFETFGATTVVENFKPKHLRLLLARSYDLVRTEIPKRNAEINYANLENILEDEDGIAKLYGITMLADPRQLPLAYPYNLTEVGKQLGYDTWHGANDLIAKVAEEKGFNLKGSDNKYHIAFQKNGTVTMRRYSDKTVTLLKRVKDGNDYYVREEPIEVSNNIEALETVD